MKKYYKGFKIKTDRSKQWDYSGRGVYFVTINTINRNPYFGNIKNGEMFLSPIGEIVAEEWLKTEEIRKDMNVELGEWVIMPDHFHAVLIIHPNQYNSAPKIDEYAGEMKLELNSLSLENSKFIELIAKGISVNKFGPQSKNLGSIIRGFKSAVTTYAKKNNIIFEWQPLYFSLIVPSLNEMEIVNKYIRNNIKNWRNEN